MGTEQTESLISRGRDLELRGRPHRVGNLLRDTISKGTRIWGNKKMEMGLM